MTVSAEANQVFMKREESCAESMGRLGVGRQRERQRQRESESESEKRAARGLEVV